MEDVPPSYEAAVDREAWNVIAPWISSSDLCSACLVSRKWHGVFVPFLWGDPASHFGIENDAVYVALTRFKRTLRKVRLSVRQLTHTLHLPPALSEIYGGPNALWLRDVLDYLPNLQSLIVSQLPFFDHPSLLALRLGSNVTQDPAETDDEPLPYSLKLLLASREPNTTSAGLAAALPRFPHLVHLDLSYTTPARDASVLSVLASLHDLQVLKLRGIGMRDGEAEVLANAINIRVRLLDLRENLLTDMAVRSLMQACFLPLDMERTRTMLNTRHVEDWPLGMAPGPDFFSLDTLRSEQLDRELLKQLTNPLTGRLAFEDIPHQGLTHLYIADNHLSVEGVASLLKSERLHVLDAGSVDTVKTITRMRSSASPSGYLDTVQFPGGEKLVPVLATSASKNLTYLRIDHAVVTKHLEVAKEMTMPRAAVGELAGSAPLSAELPAEERHIAELRAPVHYPLEMPTASHEVFELDASPPEPKYELVGDIVHFALSPPIGERPASSRSSSRQRPRPVKGDGAFAPEVLCPEPNGRQEDPDEEEVMVHASGSGLRSPQTGESVDPYWSYTPGGAQTQISPVTSLPSPSSPHPAQSRSSSVQYLARIEALLRKRPAAVLSARSTNHAELEARTIHPQVSELHPSMVPHLRTLVLTDVPPSTPQSSPVLPALKKYICACADEAALAMLRARVNYSLPPGRARQAAETQHARSLFALREIVLEMARPSADKARSDSLVKGWQHLRQRESMNKSSTGDFDSENMWSAAENDFSFFGEEGEEKDECGIYQHDPEKYFPTAHLDDKIVYTAPDALDDRRRGSPSPGATSFPSPTDLTALSRAHTHTYPLLRSPRELPLGRNPRRSSGGSVRSSFDSMREMPSSMPGPTSYPTGKALELPVVPDEPMIDVIEEIKKFRKERKMAYEQALVRWRLTNRPPAHGLVSSIGTMLSHTLASSNSGDGPPEVDMPFVEGHWKGEIKVVRNAAPKGRTGVVDVYGNYFEKGYLYP